MKTSLINDKTQTRLKAFLFLIPWIITTSFTLAQTNSPPPLKIYVSQIIQHPALDASRQGIYDELIESGYRPDIDFVWIYANAQGNTSLASQIAQKAVGEKADALVTLGTTVTQTALSAAREYGIPVIFASVTDPVGAKIVNSLEKPGDFATGVSSFTPSQPQFELFQKIQPNLKRLGIIYNPGDASNSQAVLNDMKEAAKALGIKLVFVTASKTSEVKSAAYRLANKVDAFYINNDNTALAAFQSIVQVSLETKKPAYVSDTDLVEKGALAALGPDQYQLGRQVGKLLIQVLEGTNVSDLPVEFAKKRQIITNPNIAQKLEVTIPKSIK